MSSGDGSYSSQAGGGEHAGPAEEEGATAALRHRALQGLRGLLCAPEARCEDISGSVSRLKVALRRQGAFGPVADSFGLSMSCMKC